MAKFMIAGLALVAMIALTEAGPIPLAKGVVVRRSLRGVADGGGSAKTSTKTDGGAVVTFALPFDFFGLFSTGVTTSAGLGKGVATTGSLNRAALTEARK